MNSIRQNYKSYIMLQIIIAVYSLSSVCSKAAAGQEIMSWKFLFFYGAIIFLLAVYAIVWQQVLKKIPLVTAYANKSITVIWGMIWGILIWHEKVAVNNIIGAVIIMLGVYIIATEEKEKV